MAQSAILDEVLRKLDYVERITTEAKALLTDMKVSPDNYQVIEQLQQQSEIINLLLDKLRTGKKGEDPALESKFKAIGRKYIEMKRAELGLEMDELDLDVLDGIRGKDIPRAK